MYHYPGHRIHNKFCTLSPLPEEHSGQSPFYRRAQCQLNHNIVRRILPGPHLTPGSRAAMWIKCLAEGQKYQATVGLEPGLSTWELSSHTTIPRHLHTLVWIFEWEPGFSFIHQPFMTYTYDLVFIMNNFPLFTKWMEIHDLYVPLILCLHMNSGLLWALWIAIFFIMNIGPLLVFMKILYFPPKYELRHVLIYDWWHVPWWEFAKWMFVLYTYLQ